MPLATYETLVGSPKLASATSVKSERRILRTLPLFVGEEIGIAARRVDDGLVKGTGIREDESRFFGEVGEVDLHDLAGIGVSAEVGITARRVNGGGKQRGLAAREGDGGADLLEVRKVIFATMPGSVLVPK